MYCTPHTPRQLPSAPLVPAQPQAAPGDSIADCRPATDFGNRFRQIRQRRDARRGTLDKRMLGHRVTEHLCRDSTTPDQWPSEWPHSCRSRHRGSGFATGSQPHLQAQTGPRCPRGRQRVLTSPPAVQSLTGQPCHSPAKHQPPLGSARWALRNPSKLALICSPSRKSAPRWTASATPACSGTAAKACSANPVSHEALLAPVTRAPSSSSSQMSNHSSSTAPVGNRHRLGRAATAREC